MDNLEQRLKADAADVDAEISTELEVRIAASLRAAERARPMDRKPANNYTLWWLSSLTGVAAALIIIAIFGRSGPSPEPGIVHEPTTEVVPDAVPRPPVEFPLNAQPAELTGPLEEELEKLQSDLEKARENVERDLRRSF